MPDYEIIEWNEDNSDINVCPYVRQAYDARMFAFVSDYVRGKALYELGGVYLDTDVEVLKPFDELLVHRAFWGFEAGNYIATSTIGTTPGNEIIGEYLNQYHDRMFLNADGTPDKTTNVAVVTDLLVSRGLVRDGQRQILKGGNLVVPEHFFSPYDYRLGVCRDTSETYAIHHYGKSWNGGWARAKGTAKRLAANVFGSQAISAAQKVFRRG